jgi:hypothetical protein
MCVIISAQEGLAIRVVCSHLRLLTVGLSIVLAAALLGGGIGFAMGTSPRAQQAFDLTNMRPGPARTTCVVIRGVSASWLPVRIYTAARRGPLNRFLSLTLSRGRALGRVNDGCRGFQRDRHGTVFTGTLNALLGVIDHPPPDPGAAVAYSFAVSLADSSRAQGLTSKVTFVFAGRLGNDIHVRARFTSAMLFPPDNTAPPVVRGHPTVGLPSTGALGRWSRHPDGFRERWLKCARNGSSCHSIAGATGNAYTPAYSDVGHTLRLAVAARNAGGVSAFTDSLPSIAVAAPVPNPPGPAPAPVAIPSVAGLPAVGQVLTASPGQWQGQDVAISYQWERCPVDSKSCSPIPGATASTYAARPQDRLSALAVTVTAGSPAGSASATSAPTDPIASSPNPIVVENARPGSAAWWPAGHIIDDPRAQAYTSSVSVAPGGILGVHVSTTPAASYRLEIYRLGWYGGLGGRLMGCVPGCASTETGVSQPTAAPDPATGELDAGWPVTDEVAIGSDWISGYYEVQVVLTSSSSAGDASLVPFIVTQPGQTTPSAVVVQAAVNTWEAYNPWGGKSLYSFNSTNQQAAVMVSFNRPEGKGVGAGPYEYELNVVRFLERYGWDASYVTDLDVADDPALLLGHRVAVAAGHDEYWTKEMRDGWEAARNGGVNLIFAGANIGFWQARYADGGRTLVEYRSATLDPDPDLNNKTMPFRDLATPRPECELEGVEYGHLDQGSPLAYMLAPDASADPLVSGTGLVVGEALPDMVGYEYDAVTPGCDVPGAVTVLLTDGGVPYEADAAYYRAPSGALVFATGSLDFNRGLDDWNWPGLAEPGLRTLMNNVLGDDLGL